MLLIQEEIPRDAKMEKEHSLTIRGETGKEHKITGVNVFSKGPGVYLEVTTPARVEHPEHPPLLIPPGKYRQSRVEVRDMADSLFMPQAHQAIGTTQPVRTTPVD